MLQPLLLLSLLLLPLLLLTLMPLLHRCCSARGRTDPAGS